MTIRDAFQPTVSTKRQGVDAWFWFELARNTRFHLKVFPFIKY